MIKIRNIKKYIDSNFLNTIIMSCIFTYDLLQAVKLVSFYGDIDSVEICIVYTIDTRQS